MNESDTHHAQLSCALQLDASQTEPPPDDNQLIWYNFCTWLQRIARKARLFCIEIMAACQK